MSFTSQQINKAIVAACDMIGVHKLKANKGKRLESLSRDLQVLRLHKQKLGWWMPVWLWYMRDFTQIIDKIEQAWADATVFVAICEIAFTPNHHMRDM